MERKVKGIPLTVDLKWGWIKPSFFMGKILLSLIAAIAFPIAVNAESYKDDVAKNQWPKMQQLLTDGYVLLLEDETNKACGKLAEFDLLLGMHSEALQELYPNMNWFEIKKKNEELKSFC